jgi:tRNA1(Val) A37 N6-methylase TrmN6
MSESVTLLDGKVQAGQKAAGFRSGLDAVLLGAAISLRNGESAIEFGCGTGAAMLVAAYHNPGARFLGIDSDAEAAALAERNIEANGWSDRMAVFASEIAAADVSGPAGQVFFNPPFFDDPNALKAPAEAKRAAFLSGETPLADWVALANKRLQPKGRLTLVHRADRLADILAALETRFGDVVIKPVSPYADRPAKRVLVSAKKGTMGAMKILPPLVLHDGSDRKYTPEAEAVLRGQVQVEMR